LDIHWSVLQVTGYHLEDAGDPWTFTGGHLTTLDIHWTGPSLDIEWSRPPHIISPHWIALQQVAGDVCRSPVHVWLSLAPSK
jgi:hypothetical protein